MKQLLKIFLYLLVPVFTAAQQDPFVEIWTEQQMDSLQAEWKKQPDNDTARMRLARSLAWYYAEINRDSSFHFSSIQLGLARQLKQKLWEADALDLSGWVLAQLKNYPLSLQYFMEALDILQKRDCEKNIWLISLFSRDKDTEKARLTCLASTYNDLATLYTGVGNTKKALSTLSQGLKTAQGINNATMISLITMNMAANYLRLEKTDSAFVFINTSLDNMKLSGYTTYQGEALITLGDIYLLKKEFGLAKQCYDASRVANLENNVRIGLPDNARALANYYKVLGKDDLVIYYTREAINGYRNVKRFAALAQAYASMYSLQEKAGNSDSAYFFLQLYTALNDSINKAEKEKIDAYQNLGFNAQLAMQQREKMQLQKVNRFRTYTLLTGIGIFMLITFLLYRNSQNRKKANQLLQKKNEEIETQKKNLEKTLAELKATQSQLIQSEKMASLGELTAGIAHEIQNPLNFVNNFSELSVDLAKELKEEAEKSEIDKELIIDLATDLSQNQDKINHHGKRASDIVKGMLEHSRKSTGEKESTDINALCDEYLRLAYHGLKAKDKSFNATMETNFDPNLPKIDIIPQDIGRVILNLINNAFWAVNERTNLLNLAKQSGDANLTDLAYQPTVSITTQLTANTQLLIAIKDNGSGIPAHIKEKIFQPFFTTKPTGQGTGLGLSLSYDIIKAHGGELKVETKEGEGCEFIIQLPIHQN